MGPRLRFSRNHRLLSALPLVTYQDQNSTFQTRFLAPLFPDPCLHACEERPRLTTVYLGIRGLFVKLGVLWGKQVPTTILKFVTF
jgi:hypothetical protein